MTKYQDGDRTVDFRSLDGKRAGYHEELSQLLFGRSRSSLSPDESDQLSDFAAYVSGAEEYVGTWH